MEALKGALLLGHGAILLTGPTGSGKSTTLYASLLELERRGRNVVTVEDPVEIPLPGITQVQVSPDCGLDYPTAIRSVLRHDPDALLIGEVRDSLSAKIAMEAAMTGHLTLTTIHTSGVLTVIERLTDLGVERHRCIDAISLVMSQRLLPRLCTRCRVHDLDATRRFGTALWRQVGCAACDYSGFDGRVVVCESLLMSDRRVKDRVSNQLTVDEVASLVIPWTHSLQYHLTRGSITAKQFQDFIDCEVPPL
jgi:general secretion pathway protein E